jgi:hypothetical protein
MFMAWCLVKHRDNFAFNFTVRITMLSSWGGSSSSFTSCRVQKFDAVIRAGR